MTHPKHVLAMWLTFVLPAISMSCQGPEDARLETTRRETKVNMFPGRTGVWQTVKADVLRALDAANGESLKQPTLAATMLSIGQNDQDLLKVWWLEGQPSAEGVELFLAPTNKLLKLTFPEGVLDELKARDAKYTILYYSSAVMEKADADAIRGDPSKCWVRLTRGGAAVSPKGKIYVVTAK